MDFNQPVFAGIHWYNSFKNNQLFKMKKNKIVLVLAVFLFSAVQIFAQILPPDPGPNGGGGGAAAPLDGGLLLGLLAAGGVVASLFAKKKNKDK